MARSETDWHWEEVKAAIRMNGATLKGLASELGLSASAVAIVNLKPWPRVQLGIARFLKVPPQKIWPSRYDLDGNPLRRRRCDAGKPKRPPCAEKPQKQEAA
jgi:Ner family transcriptional regulator